MSLKKKTLVVLAAGAIVASAVPAMALENEFHGMFRAIGFVSNAYDGDGTINLADGSKTQSFVEQRARLQYIAKVSDDLKLVTHFELDSRWGGDNYGAGASSGAAATGTSSAKYSGSGDSGNLDADSVMLETKNVYLDFNCPLTKANVKVGIQPWADAYQSTFALFDGAGVYVTKKFDPLTASLGWFRVNNESVAAPTNLGEHTVDIITADAKFAVNKNLTLGANYLTVLNDSLTTAGATISADGGSVPAYETLHMVGLNVAGKFDPVTFNAFAAYQFGDYSDANNSEISAYGLGATAKVKAGPGNINLAALYLSGDDDGTGLNNDQDGWQNLSAGTNYFNAANMWLLVRNPQTANTSTSIGGTTLNKGGRGFVGLFGGYDLTVDKVFANANVGAAWAAETAGSEEAYIGTELNAQVGYKLYDNLSMSIVGAYLFLGDGVNSTTAAERLPITGATADADDPYVTSIQFAYAF
ncbi:MAG: porin [Geobacter sp.]|nr:porin [Geobacter sp.]